LIYTGNLLSNLMLMFAALLLYKTQQPSQCIQLHLT